jgi:hypothetical protein
MTARTLVTRFIPPRTAQHGEYLPALEKANVEADPGRPRRSPYQPIFACAAIRLSVPAPSGRL